MRVLIVADRADALRRFRGALIADLVARGHTVALAAVPVPGVDWPPGVTVHPLPPATARWPAALVAAIRATRPDRVIAYTHKVMAIAVPLARGLGVPRVVGVLTGFGAGRPAQATARAYARRIAFDVALAPAGHLAHRLVTLQDDDAATLVARHLAPASRVRVVPGEGVDTAAFDRPVPRPTPGAVTFAFIGRVLHSKGIAHLVEAATEVARTHPHARFLAAGPACPDHHDGVSVDTLAAWQARGPVRFLGHVDDVRTVHAAADVVVLPSHAEGLSVALQEAMAAGRPAITTDVPGNRGLVRDGVTGWCVPYADPHALAAALRDALDHPDRATARGAAARDHVRAHHDLSVVLPALRAAFDLDDPADHDR